VVRCVQDVVAAHPAAPSENLQHRGTVITQKFLDFLLCDLCDLSGSVLNLLSSAYQLKAYCSRMSVASSSPVRAEWHATDRSTMKRRIFRRDNLEPIIGYSRAVRWVHDSRLGTTATGRRKTVVWRRLRANRANTAQYRIRSAHGRRAPRKTCPHAHVVANITNGEGWRAHGEFFGKIRPPRPWSKWRNGFARDAVEIEAEAIVTSRAPSNARRKTRNPRTASP